MSDIVNILTTAEIELIRIVGTIVLIVVLVSAVMLIWADKEEHE